MYNHCRLLPNHNLRYIYFIQRTRTSTTTRKRPANNRYVVLQGVRRFPRRRRRSRRDEKEFFKSQPDESRWNDGRTESNGTTAAPAVVLMETAYTPCRMITNSTVPSHSLCGGLTMCLLAIQARIFLPLLSPRPPASVNPPQRERLTTLFRLDYVI